MPLAGLRIRHRLKGQTMAGTWNHFDQEGNAVMVDVSEKKTTARTASAVGSIQVNREIMEAVVHKTAAKGDVPGRGPGGRDHGGQANLGADSHVPSSVYPQMLRGFRDR